MNIPGNIPGDIPGNNGGQIDGAGASSPTSPTSPASDSSPVATVADRTSASAHAAVRPDGQPVLRGNGKGARLSGNFNAARTPVSDEAATGNDTGIIAAHDMMTGAAAASGDRGHLTPRTSAPIGAENIAPADANSNRIRLTPGQVQRLSPNRSKTPDHLTKMARGEGDYRPAGPANEASSPAPAAGNLLDAEVSTLDSDDKPGLERRINRLNGTGDGKVFSEQKVGLKGNTYTLPRLSSRLFGGKKKALKALAQNPGAIATFTDSVRVGAKMMAKEAADLRMDGDHAGAEKLENKALEYMLESLADLHAAVDLMSDQVTESLPNTLEESALGLATEFLNLRDQVPQDGPLNASAHEGFQSAGALKEKIDAKRETGNTLAMMRGKIAEAKANPVNLNYRISLDSAASGEDAGPPEAAEDSDLGATREQAIKQFAGRHRRRSGSNPFKATTVAGMKVPRARHSGIARLSGNPEALGQYTGLVLDSLKAMTEQANLLIADGVRLDREGDPEGRDKQQLADLKNFAATEILFKMVPHDGGGRSERAAVDANSETATALRSLIAKLFDPSVQPAATVSPPPAPDHTEHNAAVLDFYLNATGDPRTGIVNGVRVPPKNVGFDAIAEYITGNVERFDQHTELTLYGLSHLCRQAELLKAADPSTPQTQDQVRSAYARAAMYAEDSLAAALTAADGTKGHNAEKLGELKNLIEVELLEKMPLPAPRFPNSRVPAQHPRFVQQLINLVDSSRD